jgi:hypothetical protein
MNAVERPALRTDTRITTKVYRRPVDQEVERRTASIQVSGILAKLEWLAAAKQPRSLARGWPASRQRRVLARLG